MITFPIDHGYLPASAYDHPLSLAWAERVFARPKACYWNALCVIRHRRCPPNWYYVEGFVVAPLGMAISHGWVATPEGRVIDPTFSTIQINEPDNPYRYLPGLGWTKIELHGLRASRFPLHNDGGRAFRREGQEPWASVMRAAYAGRDRLVNAVTADIGEDA